MPDSEGYPTKTELKHINHFTGTLPEFFDYVESLWVNGAGVVRERYVDDFGRGGTKIRFITGGWSGCEETMGVVNKTLASLLTYARWERGGLHEFDLTDNYASFEPGFWGWLKFAPKVDS